MSTSNRFNELDVFRGLAVLAVIFYHYFYRYNQLYQHVDIPSAWSRVGLYGVHFFFMISGFVIYWSLQKNANVYQFAVSRLSRIFPAYYVALLLTFTLVAVFGLPGREFGVFELIMNFTLLQEFFYIPHIDQVYWSLTMELTFYFFIALLLMAGQIKHAEYWFIPLMLISVADYSGALDLPLRVNKTLLLRHIGQFIAGIIFFRLFIGKISPVAVALLIGTMIMNFFIYPWFDSLLLMSFYGLFYLAVTGRLKWTCHPILLWLGGISYTAYLLHQNIGYIIIREVYALGGTGWLGIVIAIVVTLGMSTVLTKLVELPANRWLRKKLIKKPV